MKEGLVIYESQEGRALSLHDGTDQTKDLRALQALIPHALRWI